MPQKTENVASAIDCLVKSVCIWNVIEFNEIPLILQAMTNTIIASIMNL